MSTQSGITASQELLDAFKNLESNALIVKVSGDNTELVPDVDFNCSGDLKTIFTQLNSYLSKVYPQPAYIIIALTKQEFAFISFIPDNAPIRQKMLYASTKNTLITSLGSNNFPKSKNFAWTELEEISHDFFQQVTKTSDNSGVLSKDEQILNEINSLQDMTLASHGNLYKKQLPSMHSSSRENKLLYEFDTLLNNEFNNLHSNTNNSKLITFNIDVQKEVLNLTTSEENVKVSSLVSHLSKANLVAQPQYSIYNYQPDKFVFIYSCPSGSKVKDRMIYASSKLGLVTHLNQVLAKNDLKIDKSLEVGDIDELELSELDLETTSDPSSSASSINSATRGSLKFNKPKGPRRR
jgi:twinfilin-like protein